MDLSPHRTPPQGKTRPPFPGINPGAHRVCVIAELSANHNGSLETARELVRAAAQTGADAVKVQTYTADTITLISDRPEFKIGQGTLWDGRTLHDLYQEASLPWDWHQPLQEEAQNCGLPFFSSPFDLSAVDFLEKLGVPAYKIASPEIVDRGLIEACARTGKPILISTGMANQEEVEDAWTWARLAGAREIALLKCTAAYPASPADMNLRAMQGLCESRRATVGLSDHSFGHTAAVTAVTLGAKIIEKHLCLDRSAGGPDSGFSMEPEEFAQMVSAIRETEAMLGSGRWTLSEQEQKNRHFRRSLYVVRNVTAGETLTKENTRSIRPAEGLPPALLPDLVGQRFIEDVPAGTPLTLKLLENEGRSSAESKDGNLAVAEH